MRIVREQDHTKGAIIILVMSKRPIDRGLDRGFCS